MLANAILTACFSTSSGSLKFQSGFMEKGMKRFILLAVLIAGGIAPEANATIVQFLNRSSFDAAFPGAAIENWDSFADGTMFPNGTTVNGITYNSSFSPAQVTNFFLPSTTPNSLGQSGDSGFSPFDTISFTFITPATAFGIDINTAFLANGGYTATTNLGDVATSRFNPFPAHSTGNFVGFVSTLPFTTVSITGAAARTSVPAEGFSLDTLRVVPIPEPGAVLFGGMICGVIGIWRVSRLVARRTAVPASPDEPATC
jgi:hypothetical protein